MGLGDDLPRKCDMLKSQYQKLDQQNRKKTINYFSIELHGGSKRSEGELVREIYTQEETSAEESVFPTKVRRHQKEGQKEEKNKKLRAREMKNKDNEEIETVKTSIKILMKYALKHARKKMKNCCKR